MFDNPHEILDGFESLRRHHDAKKSIRENELTRIPIKRNARILDIGTGPGLYLKFWLNHTKNQNAQFFLLDHSELALSLCLKEAAKADSAHRVTPVLGNFEKLASLNLPTFDVIFIGNTFEYIRDPVAYIRENILPILAPDGILAIRDLDCGLVNCNLVDPALNHKVVYSRIKNNQFTSKNESTFQNPFIGRDLARIANASGLTDVESFPYFIEFKYPLTMAQKEYLWRLHSTWYVDDSLNILSPREKRTWKALFDVKNEKSGINSPDFYYVESEFLVIGRKPR